MKRIAISQSNYIPWRGYFALIRDVNQFVLYDTAQFTRRDWRNRNRIPNREGVSWLTIPVETKGRYYDTIDSITPESSAWGRSHIDRLRQTYLNSARTAEMALITQWIEHAASLTTLSEINSSLLRNISDYLEIETEFVLARNIPHSGDATGKLVSIAKHLQASAYLTAPAARNYLGIDEFNFNNISVEFANYQQLSPKPAEVEYSIVDWILTKSRADCIRSSTFLHDNSAIDDGQKT